MKRETGKWVRKAEDDWEGAQKLAAGTPPLRDLGCFHCQQAAEHYLKALLQDLGAAVPRTHDLEDLLDLLLTHDGTLAALRRALASLARYAVDYRYPGTRATSRGMRTALSHTRHIRAELRGRLDLPP
jgi:HEPN domain-containing protein